MKIPIKISDNCWKHEEYSDHDGQIAFHYRKTSDDFSDFNRIDGPAVEYSDGHKEWWINGKLHRTDGPAIEWFNGTKEWYYHDQLIAVKSQEEFELYLKNIIFV